MTATPKTVSPIEARRMMGEGARLVDIRGTDEFARARAQGEAQVALALRAIPFSKGPA